jgi:hypothetical protein
MRDTFAVGCVRIARVLGQEERQSEGTGRFLVGVADQGIPELELEG